MSVMETSSGVSMRYLLGRAGLSSDESKMYLCLFDNQKATMPALIEATGLSASSAYRTIRLLMDRGIVAAESLNRKQKIFTALPLAPLASEIANRKRSLGRLEARLRSFTALDDSRGIISPPADVIDDIDEIRDLYMSVPSAFRHEGELLCFGSLDNFWRMLGFCYGMSEERNFIRDRLRLGVAVNILSTQSDFYPQMARRDSLERRVLRISLSLPLKRDLAILGKNTGYIFVTDPQEPRCLVLRRPDLVAAYRSDFERHWQLALQR